MVAGSKTGGEERGSDSRGGGAMMGSVFAGRGGGMGSGTDEGARVSIIREEAMGSITGGEESTH